MSRKEITIVVFVFALVFVADLAGFKASMKRQRDIQRILDIGKIELGLVRYHEEFGSYPLSSDDGQMVACPGPMTAVKKDAAGVAINSGFKKPLLAGLVECVWGKDSLWDATDLNYPAYIDGLPADPLSRKGRTYLYSSDGKYFKIYGSLELKEHKEYDAKIRKLKIKCGKVNCNFGREIGVQ